MVELLLESGVNVNLECEPAEGKAIAGYDNKTALQIAVSNGNTKIIELLVDSGADVNNEFSMAVTRENLLQINRFLEFGTDIDYKNSFGTTALIGTIIPINQEDKKMLIRYLKSEEYKNVELLILQAN